MQKNDRGDGPRKVQLSAIFENLEALTLTLDRVKVISTCTIHENYQQAQPCDCSLTQYQSMAICI